MSESPITLLLNWKPNLKPDAGILQIKQRLAKVFGINGPEGQMMAVPVTATGTTFEPGTPVALLQTRIFGGGVDIGLGWQYDVTRDGRFVINTVLDEASAPITLLLNWKPKQ